MIDYFMDEASGGDVDSMFKLYSILKKQENEEKKKEALKWLKLAADHGHSEAAYIYADGLRFPRFPLEPTKEDYQEAAKYYDLAADNGHVGAQMKLGDLYFSGKGVDKNIKEGVKLYEKSAKEGFFWTQKHLS